MTGGCRAGAAGVVLRQLAMPGPPGAWDFGVTCVTPSDGPAAGLVAGAGRAGPRAGGGGSTAGSRRVLGAAAGWSAGGRGLVRRRGGAGPEAGWSGRCRASPGELA